MIMKKILFSMLSLLVAMTIFAQSESTRTMRIVHNGEVVFSRAVNLIDSIIFMKEAIDEMQLPSVPLPGEGKTTVVLHIPEDTPKGCYAVGTMNNWDINNTDFMFTPVVGAQSERWVACTFDYTEDISMKVIAIPTETKGLSWDFQWGRNYSHGYGDNVVILDGIGFLNWDYDFTTPQTLIELKNNGVVYLEVKDWYNSPIVNKAGLATFHVVVPDNTPENASISVVGNFTENAWTRDAYILKRQNDCSYHGKFEVPANFSYYYVATTFDRGYCQEQESHRMPVSLFANDSVASWGELRGEAKIKSISIKNTTCQGKVDNTAFTVVFDEVPAETPIEALQFDGEYSLGASLEKKEYDFSKGSSEDGKQYIGTIKVVNGTVSQEYQVTLNLTDPTSDPKLVKLVMQKADGTNVDARVLADAEPLAVALNMEDADEATFVSVELYPARASYSFTEAIDGKITKDNPGQLVVEFMGRKAYYNITFAAAPTPGVDIAAAVVHDFSMATKNVPAAFTAENTRGTDFDGEHVLVVSRNDDGSAFPHLHKVSDLLADNAGNKIALNTTGIEGGTHVVSSGSLNHGHIYICNLTTALSKAEPLKVYHYANANAAPEVVLEWDGVLSVTEFGDTIFATYRLGDNISVNLDENGNGYAFFCGQEGSAEKMYRVQVTNFTQFSNPIEIILDVPFPYYGYVNQVPEAGQYIFKSHYMAVIRLMDADGTPLMEDVELDATESGLNPRGGVDPQVIEFNRGRYLVFATPYNNSKRIGAGPGLFLQDITDGVDTKAALIKWSEMLYDEEYLWEPTYHYSLDPTEPEERKTVGAPAAQCNAAVVDGKLVVFTAANKAGFALIEFPPAR